MRGGVFLLYYLVLYFICKSVENNNAVIQLYKSLDDDKLNKEIEIIASAVIPENFRDSEVGLKINTIGKDFSFEYSFDRKSNKKFFEIWIAL